MSAQTPLFGHFTFDRSVITFGTVRSDSSFRTFYFWSFDHHTLKCKRRPLFSEILLLIIRLSQFKMSAQTSLFGHSTFDHSIITSCNVRSDPSFRTFCFWSLLIRSSLWRRLGIWKHIKNVEQRKAHRDHHISNFTIQCNVQTRIGTL